MALNPFRRDYSAALSDVQDEVNRMFDRLWHGGVSAGPFDGQEWAPPIDLYESNEFFIVRAEVPGLSRDDIEVSLTGQVLALKGTKVPPPDDPAQGRRVQGERRFGRFNRAIELPGEVEAGPVSAVCRAGVLEVRLPKSAASRPKSIEIRVED